MAQKSATSTITSIDADDGDALVFTFNDKGAPIQCLLPASDERVETVKTAHRSLAGALPISCAIVYDDALQTKHIAAGGVVLTVNTLYDLHEV